MLSIFSFSCDFWPFVYFLWRNPLPILLGLVFLLLDMSWMLIPIIIYMIYKYFLPIYGVSFHPVENVLWCTDFKIFFESSLSGFYFVACGFGLISKETLPNLMSWSFSHVFSFPQLNCRYLQGRNWVTVVTTLPSITVSTGWKEKALGKKFLKV